MFQPMLYIYISGQIFLFALIIAFYQLPENSTHKADINMTILVPKDEILIKSIITPSVLFSTED